MTYADLLNLYPFIAKLTPEQLAEFVYRIGVLDGKQDQLRARLEELDRKEGRL